MSTFVSGEGKNRFLCFLYKNVLEESPGFKVSWHIYGYSFLIIIIIIIKVGSLGQVFKTFRYLDAHIVIWKDI